MLARLRADAGDHPSGGRSRRALSRREPADQFTPARPFHLDSAGRLVRRARGEPDDVRRSCVRPGPRRAARRSSSSPGSTVVALEQPNRSRGVVIDTPPLWDPEPGRVGAVLAGLRDNPLLAGARLTDIFDSVQAATATASPYVREPRAVARRLRDRDAGRVPDAPARRSTRSRSMIGATTRSSRKARHELVRDPGERRAPHRSGRAATARLATIHADGRDDHAARSSPRRAARSGSRPGGPSVPLSFENTHRPAGAGPDPVRRARSSSSPSGAEQIVDPAAAEHHHPVRRRVPRLGHVPACSSPSAHPDGRLAARSGPATPSAPRS